MLPEPVFFEGRAEMAGLELERLVQKTSAGFSLRLRLCNKRASPVRVLRLTLFRIDEAGGVFPESGTMDSWRVFRMAPHKNDMPGFFRPGHPDEAMEDITFDTSEVVAGNGVEEAPAGGPTGPPRRFTADPAMVFETRPGARPLLLGFIGQDLHLSEVTLETSRDRKCLARMEATAFYDGALLRPGESLQTHELVLRDGSDARELLDALTEDVARLYGRSDPPPRRPTVFCSWYYYGPNFTEADLHENLDLLQTRDIPCDVVQVDDSWIDRYGDWNANDRFPSGLDAMAAAIRTAGFLYHKLDFVRALVLSPNACFHDPAKNLAQAYRRALTLVREALDTDGYILVCGGLYEASAGLADAVRSSRDVQGRWRQEGTRNANYLLRIRQNVSRLHYHRLFHLDSDALQLRRRTERFRGDEKHHHLAMGTFTEEEVFTTVVNAFLSGGIACFSDRLKELDADRLLLLRHVVPPLAPAAIVMDPDREAYCPGIFLTRFDQPGNGLPPWCVVTLLNGSDEERVLRFPLSRAWPAGGDFDAVAVFEFREQCFLGRFSALDEPALRVPAHASRSLRITPLLRPNRPVLIGTDMSLTQGLEVTVGSDGEFAAVPTGWAVPLKLTLLESDGVTRTAPLHGT